MENKNIIMYTMKSCGYCVQMKKSLNESEVQFEERDSKEWKEDWEKVKAITRSAVFPTFVIGKEYLVPNRDFNSPKEAVQVLQYYKTAYQEESSLTEVIELVKNSIYMIKMTLDEIKKLEKRFDDLESKQQGLDEREKMRQQIVQRNKLIAEQRKGTQVDKNKIIKDQLKNNDESLKRYVDRRS